MPSAAGPCRTGLREPDRRQDPVPTLVTCSGAAHDHSSQLSAPMPSGARASNPRPTGCFADQARRPPGPARTSTRPGTQPGCTGVRAARPSCSAPRTSSTPGRAGPASPPRRPRTQQASAPTSRCWCHGARPHAPVAAGTWDTCSPTVRHPPASDGASTAPPSLSTSLGLHTRRGRPTDLTAPYGKGRPSCLATSVTAIARSAVASAPHCFCPRPFTAIGSAYAVMSGVRLPDRRRSDSSPDRRSNREACGCHHLVP